jgi:hypothetical protein
MVGTFYGDSKSCHFPYLTDHYRRLSMALSGANVCFWPKADILIAWANVRFRG